MAIVVQSAVRICNMSLAHLAIGKQILALTDTSTNGLSCALFYPQVKAEVLRDFPWPFAWRYAPLTLVDGTEEVASTQDFQYAYRLPADTLSVHRILGADRTEDDDARIPFSLGSDDAGGLIYTDEAPVDATDTTLAQPELEYIADVDEARFPPDVAMAMSLKLAGYMAPSLTAGDQFKLGARAFELYGEMLLQAHGAAAREQQLDPPPESSFITARN